MNLHMGYTYVQAHLLTFGVALCVILIYVFDRYVLHVCFMLPNVCMKLKHTDAYTKVVGLFILSQSFMCVCVCGNINSHTKKYYTHHVVVHVLYKDIELH